LARRNPLVVVDSSPVISLCSIGQLPLLAKLFERIIVPLDVWQELADRSEAPEPQALSLLREVNVLAPRGPAPHEAFLLGAGERSAISLALEYPDAWLLVDEVRARKVAARVGLVARGTLAVLVEAKRRALVAAIAPLLEQLVATGTRLGPAVIAAALRAAGE
jgi:hypothetical protein